MKFMYPPPHAYTHPFSYQNGSILFFFFTENLSIGKNKSRRKQAGVGINPVLQPGKIHFDSKSFLFFFFFLNNYPVLSVTVVNNNNIIVATMT